MSVCYSCGVEEDYTDQFSTPNGAACWNCYKKHHMTDVQRRDLDYHDQIRKIATVLGKISWQKDLVYYTVEQRINLIRAIIDGKPEGSWGELLETIKSINKRFRLS